MTVLDMFAKYMLAIFLGFMAFSVSAYEAECPDNAIDAIEDEDRYSHCTYDDSGLNGQLKSFFDERNNGDKSKREVDAVTVYDTVKSEPLVEQSLESAAVVSASVDNAPVVASEVEKPVDRTIYNIREPFDLTNGPGNAINGLYRQMAKYCPNGWDKLAEWSEPSGTNYYLHYQFQCAK